MTNNAYLNAFLIILGFYLGSYIITFLLGLLEKASSKTGSDLDDKIIEAVKLPIRHLFILIGIFYAARDVAWSWTINNREYGFSDIFFVLIILLVSYTVSRMLKTVFTWYGERESARSLSQTAYIFIRKIISVVVYTIAALIAFSQLGIQIGPLLAGLGVAGLAVALGLQEPMANLFAALFLVMDKSISIGDWIQLDDGTKAYIEDISWRSVRIRTIAGNTVIVPNSVFVGQKISSYDYPEKSFFTSITVGVSYDTDLDKAEYIATQAAEKVIKDQGISIQENNPIIRYKELAASSINFSLIVKVDNVQSEGKVKHALIKEVVKQFKAQNIEIPFPQMVIHQDK